MLKVRLFGPGKVPIGFKGKLIIFNASWPENPAQFIRTVLDNHNDIGLKVKLAEYPNGSVYHR